MLFLPSYFPLTHNNFWLHMLDVIFSFELYFLLVCFFRMTFGEYLVSIGYQDLELVIALWFFSYFLDKCFEMPPTLLLLSAILLFKCSKPDYDFAELKFPALDAA